MFIGEKTLLPPGFTIDNLFKHAYYQVDWETDGHHPRYIPLDLHGNHSPMAQHCMLKETYTISYIQQARHEWIKGDEETIYTQATESFKVVPIESLRVVPTNIQHGPEILQRFKVVVTLALGSRPKQRGYKGAGQEKARESHHILPRV